MDDGIYVIKETCPHHIDLETASQPACQKTELCPGCPCAPAILLPQSPRPPARTKQVMPAGLSRTLAIDFCSKGTALG